MKYFTCLKQLWFTPLGIAAWCFFILPGAIATYGAFRQNDIKSALICLSATIVFFFLIPVIIMFERR